MLQFRHQLILALLVAIAFGMWWEFGRAGRDIFIAAEEGDSSAVTAMLQEGHHVDARGPRGRTALVCAAAAHRDGVVGLLLAANANVNIADDLGRTALMEVCGGGMNQLASDLLQKGANPNMADHDKITAMMEAARGGYATTVQLLLDVGADANMVDKNGDTALMKAVGCEKGGAAVNALLAGGADPNIKNLQGQTALDMAIAFHRADAANFLVLNPETRVPDKAWYTGTDLMRAVYWGQRDAAGSILAENPSSAGKKDALGRTALMRVSDDNLQLVDLLLGANAKINDTDDEGNTALIYAAMHKQEKLVQYLLDRGAEPDIKNKAGKTAADILGRPLARVSR